VPPPLGEIGVSALPKARVSLLLFKSHLYSPRFFPLFKGDPVPQIPLVRVSRPICSSFEQILIFQALSFSSFFPFYSQAKSFFPSQCVFSANDLLFTVSKRMSRLRILSLFLRFPPMAFRATFSKGCALPWNFFFFFFFFFFFGEGFPAFFRLRSFRKCDVRKKDPYFSYETTSPLAQLLPTPTLIFAFSSPL